MRFSATPIERDEAAGFFRSAPIVVHTRRTFDAPPQQIWDVVTGDRMWSWLPMVWGCRYPAHTPPAAGVVRDFQMYIHHRLVFAQHERITRFDDLNVMRYTAIDATLPVFGAWCEEYRVEPGPDDDSAVLDWTLACAPRYLSRIPGNRILFRMFSRFLKPIFHFGLRGLERELPSHAPSTLASERPLVAIDYV